MQETISFTPQAGRPRRSRRSLWLIPAVPIVASGVIALLKQPQRKTRVERWPSGRWSSLCCSRWSPLRTCLSGWTHGACGARDVELHLDSVSARLTVDLGWVLDPLSAVMLVMVTFVGLLIFIYSTGYMAHDENYTRFFCFLCLFAGAMLGVVIANSMLLLFMCWELVGLTSYLLIGFWYQKPSAAAAAKKAFLTTRVGDVFFLLGIVWLFAQTGTLLFYNGGAGSMETHALTALLLEQSAFGLTAASAIGLLIFAGAAGKSGQFPLHVWLPDAMEGPTPVSALIHAATMVAAGVYLIARVYPLMQAGMPAGGTTTALTVVTWVGAFTAVFAALIAVAQNDIKRILAYSTVSQLGYMMAGLGDGRRGGGHVPPDYARVLQGAAVHGRGLGDSRLPRRAGRTADGRIAVEDAVDLCNLRSRHAGAVRRSDPLFRLLVEGRNSRSGATLQPEQRPVLHAGLRRAADGVLYDAAGELRLLRQLSRARASA